MPPLTRWYLRTGMIYFLAALTVGVLLRIPAMVEAYPALAVFGPTHLHLLVVGWLTQVIFGVAYWMFPRYSAKRPRGHEVLGWAAFLWLNGGLLLRVMGEPAHALGRGSGGLLVTSASLQLLAGWAFVLNTWPRVRAR